MPGILPNAADDENVLDAETLEYPPYEDDLCKEEKRLEVDDYSHDGYNKLISAQVMLPLGDAKQPARVIRQKRDVDGAPIGQASTNPYLDTSLYEVEFNNEHVEAYSANLIAESMYEQFDDEGNKYRLIDEIIGHEKDSSTIPTSEATIIVNGRQHPKRMT